MTNPAYVFDRKSLRLEAAFTLVRVAQAHAATLGCAVSVTVVDESGVLKAFGRMDGAPLVSVDVAHKKARTAVGLGLPTGRAWHDFIKDDPILLLGAPSIPEFTLLGGGVPVVLEGALVGALGVSGGHYAQDEACAQAALASLAKAEPDSGQA